MPVPGGKGDPDRGLPCPGARLGRGVPVPGEGVMGGMEVGRGKGGEGRGPGPGGGGGGVSRCDTSGSSPPPPRCPSWVQPFGR